MNWKQAITTSEDSAARQEQGASISLFSEDEYDIFQSNGYGDGFAFCGVPEHGVERVLEELSIPQSGWNPHNRVRK